MLRIIALFIIFFFLTFASFANDQYFQTLRNDVVNLRQGPSKEYPVKINKHICYCVTIHK